MCDGVGVSVCVCDGVCMCDDGVCDGVWCVRWCVCVYDGVCMCD